MKPKSFMVIAGEASGDLLAGELVQALRETLARVQAAPTADYQPLQASLEPRFFGAGGPRMAAAGVELAFDLTALSVIGLSDVLRHYLTFRRLFHRLFDLALERQPDAIVCVDFSGFNSRFAHAVASYARGRHDWFHDWSPKLIQFVSPQVWASREGRARRMARDYDLLLSIFPFEKDWFAKRVPGFRVEFVGHPMVDRHLPPAGTPPSPPAGLSAVASAKAGALAEAGGGSESSAARVPAGPPAPGRTPMVLLLPGSRPAELRRHLPVLVEAAKRIASLLPVSFQMIVPNEALAPAARAAAAQVPGLEVQIGGLAEALRRTDLAVTKSGTITLECACFGVPAVVFYKTSATTYLAAKPLVKVKYVSMPNLLADEPLFPEFLQGAATAENLAGAAVELLRDEPRRAVLKARLAEVVAALGGPGASHRAARAIVGLLQG